MRISKKRKWASCVSCALALLLLPARVAPLAASFANVMTAPQIDIEPLVQKIPRAGSLNVVVTLKLPQPYVAEEQLLIPAAIEKQRAAITQARNTLLASLRGSGAREYAKLHPRPEVALNVDAAALRALAQNPLAAAIEEDARPSTLAPEYRPELARLTAKAEQTGTVNVIVGLTLPEPYRPESRSSDPAAVTRQRAAIAQARDGLLASLRTTGATAYAQWDPLPMVALRVNAAALKLLADSPLITTIKEDGLSRPQ